MKSYLVTPHAWRIIISFLNVFIEREKYFFSFSVEKKKKWTRNHRRPKNLELFPDRGGAVTRCPIWTLTLQPTPAPCSGHPAKSWWTFGYAR
jgi:hypothetical protein